LLPTPRPATSCRSPRPVAFPSPDGALTALVIPADPSLYATPDMESRVVIIKGQVKGRAKGNTRGGPEIRGDAIRAAKDYSSPHGANGYYVVHARWSPDSQYFVYSLSSSGGHSPWQSPMAVYARAANEFANFSDLIGGEPTLSPNFTMTGAHRVVATTWRDHDIAKPKTVTVDLQEAWSKRPAP